MMSETKLKTTRIQKGLTQEKIAKQSGISKRAYQYYEDGKRLPNVLNAILIARALNSTVEELFSQRKDTTNGDENQKI